IIETDAVSVRFISRLTVSSLLRNCNHYRQSTTVNTPQKTTFDSAICPISYSLLHVTTISLSPQLILGAFCSDPSYPAKAHALLSCTTLKMTGLPLQGYLWSSVSRQSDTNSCL